MKIVVGIGEYAISNHQDDILKIYGLGSCVAVAIYSSRRQVLGLAHIPLPYANLEDDSFRLQPGRYVNTAVPLLLFKMKTEYQCKKSELNAKIIGGAQSAQLNDVYKIGENNVKAAKRILTYYNLAFTEIDTGGSCARSLAIDVATGTIELKRIYSSANQQDGVLSETDFYRFPFAPTLSNEAIR